MSESKPRRTASDWVALLASKKVTAADLRRLRAWLAADPLNWRQFDEARRLWVGLGQLQAPVLQSLPRKRPAAVTMGLAAAAASVVIAVLVGRFVSYDLVAPVGEVRELLLADGSHLWLDSGAAADFHQGAGGRTLRVARGRVHVSVAEHETPFRVEAQGAVIRDVGTAFTVDTETDRLRVAVTEGIVEVAVHDALTTLEAGHSATYSAGQGVELSSFSLAAESQWRDGRIVLDRTSLEAALREVDRYRPGRILLLDTAAGNNVVSGSIALGNIEGGLDSLADAQGLSLIRLPGLALVISEQ